MADNKPGYRTTEFWIAGVPGLLLTILQGLLQWGVPLPGWVGPVMTIAYALSRGLAKQNQ